ncbi:hypothetical protein SISSUDRAFT_680542 [Sistotremastrum suecicum HHB10207 ss-3]|uniref:Uncharacterized protein n=1 Tax=Sistotremastrum suecicum HHB10207 ss-3 TaxID=1314776 RepID=A0A165WZ73_9AGAM|nr:hypothetical protein SISSUDRAFT_680542 [Sistotremastrum suecicum HHB10207 ss-3]
MTEDYGCPLVKFVHITTALFVGFPHSLSPSLSCLEPCFVIAPVAQFSTACRSWCVLGMVVGHGSLTPYGLSSTGLQFWIASGDAFHFYSRCCLVRTTIALGSSAWCLIWGVVHLSSEASCVVCIACDHPAYVVSSPFPISAVPRYHSSGCGVCGD